MQVVFHERYREVYACDPAAAYGRMDSMYDELIKSYPFVRPEPASETDILLVHKTEHLERFKRNPQLFEVASLAVGGAIKASELAVSGKKAFGLIRPPGHHASPGSCWGFCYFNNIAVAVEKLIRSGVVNKALIVDIDLHFGDGTEKIFHGRSDVIYHHVSGKTREDFLNDLKDVLENEKGYGIIGVSAGFDRHISDWGRLLTTGDYTETGKIISQSAGRVCQGKVFTVLEGGYNHNVLGLNAKALLSGLEQI
jgi:acetoin utilization deacetylase AcuC-like enzyme